MSIWNFKKILIAVLMSETVLLACSSLAQAGRKEAAAPEPIEPAEEVFVYDDHGQRDPFWPLVTSSGAIITPEKDLTITDMILEGIMTEGSGNNTAIINGRILKVNDAFGSFVIKNIGTDQVILQKGKMIYTLKLKKEEQYAP